MAVYFLTMMACTSSHSESKLYNLNGICFYSTGHAERSYPEIFKITSESRQPILVNHLKSENIRLSPENRSSPLKCLSTDKEFTHFAFSLEPHTDGVFAHVVNIFSEDGKIIAVEVGDIPNK